MEFEDGAEDPTGVDINERNRLLKVSPSHNMELAEIGIEENI
jgi:hypothetical protein